MPKSVNPGITPREFRDNYIGGGFAYLGTVVDRFVDLRFPKHGRYILPVKDARGRTLYQATLIALQASRHASEQEKQAADTEAARKVSIAAKIAPQAMAKARAGLADAEAIAVLADDFRNANARDAGVSFRDMRLLGWTDAQLRQYGDLARQTAYQLEAAQ